MNDQLMLGILLIIVGVAVGLIAVALVLNRRESRSSDEEGEAEQEAEPEVEAEIEDEDEGEEEGEAPKPQEELEHPESDGEESDGEEMEHESQPPADIPEEVEQEQVEPRDRQLVAQVYREDVTGRLIVLSGDNEYTSVGEIKDDTERRKLAYAASDFANWFQGEIGPRPASTPATAPPQNSPDVMLEEINGILQRSISPERGVRLFPGLDGGVKVLIGVKSYEIEEVPDEEIKGLIRQAVAEWEAGR